MARSVTSILFILCFFSKAFSQSTCPPNLDFESGNFDHWECFIGNTDTFAGKNRMNLTLSDPQANRHEIISAANNPGNDQYGGFPKLCPYGGNFSVKLGNNSTGAQAEAISYTFQVPTTVDTFTFTYFYAVVFEDPQHSLPEQPRFFVTAYDVTTGLLINCASYDYVSSSVLPGFQRSPQNAQVLYKGWTPTSLQFAGLGGHDVRLEFRTADCTPGAHFGYAYMDVASACSNILATAPYCIETNSLILDAPFGFKNYTWYNSDYTTIIGYGQSMTISPPPVTSGSFHVDVEPYPGFGCRDTLLAIVKPMPVPGIPTATDVILCQNQTPDPLSASVLPGHQLNWYTTPTGGIPTSTAPRPPTSAIGILKYYVSQKELFGCEGFRKEVIATVKPSPVTSFNINSTLRQCLNGNSFNFTSTSTNLNNPRYAWAFGDGKTDTTTTPFTNYSYVTAGVFTVKLNTINDGLCKTEDTKSVTLIPKPIATFMYPIPICENQTLITLTDRSAVPSGIANINRWWWDINGQIVQSQTPPSFPSPPGGPYPVKLVVTTIEGCRSDTNYTTLNIRFKPLPEFGIGDLMCNNEIIRLTDQSVMPPNAIGEAVSKWNWTFDNSITTNVQNPARNFNTGIHKAKLISENNFGCASIPVEHSFEIFPKPVIKLDISDSCILVPITYTATDLVGNVVKWDWNFDHFFKPGRTTFTKTYFAEGNNPLVLLAYTDKACKDTIIRPFYIYENKSDAGKDTLVAFNEPLQLDAKGEAGMQYTWTPSTGLNQWNIEKPVATYDKDQLYQLYTVTAQGCKKQTQIFVKRWAGPELFVPNAFTPNSDGVNDRLKVKPVGIRSFGYFAVFNRWGQMVYRTTNYNEGWDGTLGGQKVDAGTFVYVAQAIDYRGKEMIKKGTVVLLR